MTPRSIDRKLESGAWIRVLPSVYRFASAPQSWLQNLHAACLWGGDDAVVSHRAAAKLMSIEAAENCLPELTVPSSRKRRPGVIVHTGLVHAGDVTRKQGLRVTNPIRTLVDLSAVLNPASVEEILEEMLRRGLISQVRLEVRLRDFGTRGREGAAALHRILKIRGDGPAAESLLEAKVLRLLRKSGLPNPVRQLEVSDQEGLIGRLDLAYPEGFLGIECDGYRWHSGRRVWGADRNRLNRLSSLGWTIIHFTWDDLRDPTRVLAHIARILERTGRGFGR